MDEGLDLHIGGHDAGSTCSCLLQLLPLAGMKANAANGVNSLAQATNTAQKSKASRGHTCLTVGGVNVAGNETLGA